MRAVVVGMGVQGKKRKSILGKKFVYSADKFIKSGDTETEKKQKMEKIDPSKAVPIITILLS